MALKRGIVELSCYDKRWKEEYKKEKELLEMVLGDKIIEIHHVGSTSVDGLSAKPIIDILIVIEDLSLIFEIEKILNKYEYTNMGQHDINDQYFFAKGSDDARTHYIHFTIPNSDTYYNLIYFKRYLLEHLEYMKKYMKLKEELALKYKNERKKYTMAKKDFIREVISLAKKEYN